VSNEGQRIPHLVFTKGGGLWLEEIAAAAPDVVGVDWTVNLGAARARVGDRVALQGNIDPNVLFAQPAQIQAEVERTLQSFGNPVNDRGLCGGHIFNLGHGINQHTPPESVAVLVDAVHEVSKKMRLSTLTTA
jgi:uroporphyrinogen decarboxylase